MSRVAGIILGAVTLNPLWGQRFLLSDGSGLDAAETTLRKGVLVQVVQVDSGAGVVERTFRLEEVVQLDWPEPDGLEEARRLLAAGEFATALQVLDPIIKQFAPFATTAGSWWLEAARVRLQVLRQIDATGATQKTAREIAALAKDPEAVGEARLALSELEVRAGRTRLAEAMLESILSGSVPAAVRARAWLLRGDIAMSDGRYEAAIESYLRLPVFYGAYADLVPDALMAGERAFRALGDEAQADRLARERARWVGTAGTRRATTTPFPPPEPI